MRRRRRVGGWSSWPRGETLVRRRHSRGVGGAGAAGTPLICDDEAPFKCMGKAHGVLQGGGALQLNVGLEGIPEAVGEEGNMLRLRDVLALGQMREE